MLHIDSCQFAATAPAFNLPHLHLTPLLGVNPFEFYQGLRYQKLESRGYCVVLLVSS